MEKEWQMKCGLTLSTPILSSSIQIPPQEPGNMMKANLGHCALHHDIQEPILMSPGIKSAPSLSYMLNFGSSKPVLGESGYSYLSPVSAPPSFSQHDFQQQSCGSFYPENSAFCDMGATPSWPLFQNNGSLNPSRSTPASDIHPAIPFRPTMSTNNYSVDGQYNELGALRTVISNAGSRIEKGSTALHRGLSYPSFRNANGQMFHGSNGNAVLEVSLQAPSSANTKQNSVGTSSPRVFCMSVCGDLLLSNTGLLGILCSCHGLHMSVSNFCEHSGLFDVNPGYAIRMDTGECIALWRKLYLQKFGIRAPDDNRGWDWPEGLSSTSSLVRSNMAVPDGNKVFDLPSLFTPSAETVESSQPRNNALPRKLQLSQECANNMSKTELGNGYFQQSFLMGRTKIPGRNSHNTTDNPLIACRAPSFSLTSRASVQGGSRSDHHSSSFHSTSENLFSFAYPNVQSIGSNTHNNLKDENVRQRGALPSSIELKLGQPSQQDLSVGSNTLTTTRSNFMDLQTTTFPEQVTHKLVDSKVIEHEDQLLHFHPASHLRKTKDQYLLDLLTNSPSTVNRDSGLEHLKDGLYNISEISMPIPLSNTSAGSSSMLHKENNKGINGSHHYSPGRQHSQAHAGKSRLMEFSYNGGDGPIWPMGIKELALGKKESSSMNPQCGQYSNVGNLSSSRFCVQQMENSGFFMKENVCSLGSILDPGHTSQSLGFGATQSQQASFFGSTPLPMVQGPNYQPNFLNKDVHAGNPHRPNESLRVVSLRSTDQSLKPKAPDASIGLSRSPRIHLDNKEWIKNCNISDVGVQCSFVDPGPSKGTYELPNTIGDDAISTFGPHIGGKKAFDIGNETTAEGNNKWNGLGVLIPEMGVNSEVIDEYLEDPSAPQSKEQCSLSLGRCERNVNGHNMLQRCCEGSYTYIPGRCCCSVPSIFSNREYSSKDASSMNGLKKQAGVGVPKLDGLRFSDNCVPSIKPVILECSQNMKGNIHGKVIDLGSQWRDVPLKGNPVSKLSDPSSLAKLLSKNGQSEPHLKEGGAKGVSSDNVANFLVNKLSNVSCGSSSPGVTHASVVVDKIAVDASDIRKGNDRIADEGSVIDLSSSSVNAVDSIESSQHACCGKARSTEEVSPNVASCDLTGEFKQRHSELKESQNSDDFGARCGEVSNAIQKNDNGVKARKRKYTTKWKRLGKSLPVSRVSLSPSDTRNASEHHVLASEDVQVFLQSNQDSSNYFDANIKDRSFERRRSALSSVNTLSRKRDPNGMFNTLESESDDQRPLKGNDESVEGLDSVSVKRSRHVKPTESVMRPVKTAEDAKQVCLYDPGADGSLKYSAQRYQKPALVSDENICNQMAKPVACGKYGIICNREMDLDQLKPPKIVSLEQVLKSSRRLSKFENEHALATGRYMLHASNGHKTIHGSMPSSNQQASNVLSFKGCFHEASSHDTFVKYQKEDEISADDWSDFGRVGIDGSKRKTSFLSYHSASQSKPNEIRVRSVYELSMRGKEFLSAGFRLRQTVMCELSTELELERGAYEGTGEGDGAKYNSVNRRSLKKPACHSLVSELDAACCVCGISDKDGSNCLLECGSCFIRIHQACYGISRVSKGEWYCRPCKTGADNVVCVLCGYGGGAMTRAFGSRGIVKSLLKAWNIRTESHTKSLVSAQTLYVPARMGSESSKVQPSSSIKPMVHNSIVAGLFDRTIRQWVHMLCGLLTPGTRCPNVDTMSAFDVSGVSRPKAHTVCYICKRPGGSCIQCHIETCSSYFHSWCAHQKGLLQSEVQCFDNHKHGFFGRCLLHANQTSVTETDDDTNKIESEAEQEKEPTCARTEVYRGRKLEGAKQTSRQHNCKDKCLVTQVQLDAWFYINRQKLRMKRLPKPPVSDAENDYKKEYARYKQAKAWKQLVVYKSGIHALGLYTSLFIPFGAMVVEYVGEIVGPRVADKREFEYLSGRKLQYKGACYFFRIDKERIIDATCKGGIARFVNHSCQPNCVAKVTTIRSEKKVVFFAQRDIYPGEEITYDYHFNNEDEGKKIPCFCKSSNCRRYLN